MSDAPRDCLLTPEALREEESERGRLACLEELVRVAGQCLTFGRRTVAAPDAEDGEYLKSDRAPLLPSSSSSWLLPPRQPGEEGKLCVVLDLDETLVQNRLPQGMIERPFLRELLDGLKGRCELVLWTASTTEVAGKAVESLDPDRDVFDHVVYRDSRWFQGESGYTKDLRLLGRDMKRTVIVENTVACVKLNPGNALMVEDFWGDLGIEDACLKQTFLLVTSLLGGGCVAEMLKKSPLVTHRTKVDTASGSSVTLACVPSFEPPSNTISFLGELARRFRDPLPWEAE
eukprot:Hpha_TRINITY_DN15912_c4_g2::TRINITY_DN15912_c4_g2_i1::g.70881::m.70881/K15731/CTDSP; carboxy-terminal domain RNA polymerase II polypeptide A small phosphatase